MDLAKLLDVMEVESRKRKAPVYELKSELRTPFHHLVAALLSSRTRDEITIQAAQRLLDLADSPEKLASMSVSEIEDLIKGVGFYRVKARRLKELATILVKRYNSKVPLQFEELIKLPGIGRKSANVVLAHLGHPAIAVDTHVHRVSNRIGLVKTKKPNETEAELKKIFPEKLWNRVNRVFVGFGQTVCKPQKPLCNECQLDWLENDVHPD